MKSFISFDWINHIKLREKQQISIITLSYSLVKMLEFQIKGTVVYGLCSFLDYSASFISTTTGPFTTGLRSFHFIDF